MTTTNEHAGGLYAVGDGVSDKPITFNHEGHTCEVLPVRETYDDSWEVRVFIRDPQPVTFLMLVQMADARTREIAIERGLYTLRAQITEWATATLDSAERIKAARAKP